MKKNSLKPVVFMSLFIFLVSPVFAAPEPAAPAPSGPSAKLDERIGKAREILRQIMEAPDQSIPEELLAKCKAIVIYPSAPKIAVIFGGKGGDGVVLKRDEKSGEWGPVAFSRIAGVNVGFQIGFQVTDLILVVMNDRGLDGLLSNHLTLGVDASVAAGPVGRYTSANTDISLSAPILSYSRSWGAFAGVALDGAIIMVDNDSNKQYYGRPLAVGEILFGGTVKVQPSSKELVSDLNDYSSRWAKNPRPLNQDKAIQEKKYDYEGEIIELDAKKGEIVVLDTRPSKDREKDEAAMKKIRVEPSVLARFKLHDRVKVIFRADRDKNYAEHIVKS